MSPTEAASAFRPYPSEAQASNRKQDTASATTPGSAPGYLPPAAEYLSRRESTESTPPPSPPTTTPEGISAEQVVKNFDMEQFQARMRQELLDMVSQAKKTAEDAGLEMVDPMLYAVKEDEVAAEVPEYWNAENTSQRIVDFAMSFESVAGLEGGEFVNQMRDAVVAGFQEARNILGELPGPVGKLFNDTYELTMKKFDQLRSPEHSSSSNATPLDLTA